MLNSYRTALSIAKKVHQNQKDLAGKPYILHPLYVESHVKGKKAKIVALLHDVLEDGDVKMSYLTRLFSADVCLAIETLTRKKDQNYFSYIKEIKGNKLARTVKIVDLEHNMQITRLPYITEKDYKRLKKYLAAYRLLTDEQ